MWKRDPSSDEGDKKRAADALTEPLKEHMRDKVLKGWTEKDHEEGMVSAFKRARGAGALDGFRGAELAILPEGVARKFYEVTREWRRQRAVPGMM